MADCAAEKENLHYRGSEAGHGPVMDAEDVAFAVFERTERDGSQLTAKSFNRKQLLRGQQSVSRLWYINLADLMSHVAEPMKAQSGDVVGVSIACVQRLRALQRQHPDDAARTIRGVCILAKVENGDHDSHASLSFSEAQEEIRDNKDNTKKARLRSEILADLADEFGPIVAADTIAWGQRPS